MTKSLLGTRTGLFLRHTLQVEWCLSTRSIIPWKRYEAAPHATSWLDRVLLKVPETTVYGSQHLERAPKIKAQKSNHCWSSFLLRKSTWWFCGYVHYSLLKAKYEYSSSSVKNIQVNDKTIKYPTHVTVLEARSCTLFLHIGNHWGCRIWPLRPHNTFVR